MTRKFGDWKKLGITLNRIADYSHRAMQGAIAKEAFRIARAMQNVVRWGRNADGPLTPNAVITQFLKGSSKPLMDHGDLLGSIKAVQVLPGAWFVGVNRATPHPRTTSKSNVAAILEFGAGVPSGSGAGESGPIFGIFQVVTEAQRKFFMFLKMSGLIRGIPRVGDIIWIRIPGRSFVGSTWKQMQPGINQRIAKDYLKNIRLISRF